MFVLPLVALIACALTRAPGLCLAVQYTVLLAAIMRTRRP
jgi:hypothetical protein